MCGIIGYVGHEGATELLLRGLGNLDYRGYDSAGLALKNGAGVEVCKREGAVEDLAALVERTEVDGHVGLGHTRWSTHGAPTDDNAHPHTDCSGSIAVVHNGIIDNYDQLRDRLETAGHEFTSETDTEVLPHLVELYRRQTGSIEDAFREAIGELSGSYAVAMVTADSDTILATRSGSPLVVGVGTNECYLASDVPAFLEFTRDVVYVEDGDVVELRPTGYRVTDHTGQCVTRPVETVDWAPEDAEKGGFDHYMLKEIHEQPSSLEQTLRGRLPGPADLPAGGAESSVSAADSSPATAVSRNSRAIPPDGEERRDDDEVRADGEGVQSCGEGIQPNGDGVRSGQQTGKNRQTMEGTGSSVDVRAVAKGSVGWSNNGDPIVGELDTTITTQAKAVQFVACGTSFHAALYGQQLLSNRGIPAQTMLASEFVATPPPLGEETLVVGVTQSGETADTLEALRQARTDGHSTLAVTNVVGSTATRECDETLLIRAGPEIGVAATKTFSSQVATLALLASHLADSADRSLLRSLGTLPAKVDSVLKGERLEALAEQFRSSEAYFFIGRGVGHPVALEGALKLKEISYRHAEGFPAGELKHGPLALVTDETPVFAIMTGSHEERMRGTIQEVSARGAPVVALTNGLGELDHVDHQLPVPSTHPELAGVLVNVQLQLFSYYTARLLDRPVDKPRHLAKSVTVE